MAQPQAEKILCDECNEQSPTVSAAIQHKFRKHKQSNIKHFCPFCGQQFPIKYCRDKHVQSHGKKEEGRGMHICMECAFSFYNESALAYHQKSTHNRVVKLIKTIETPPPSRKIKYNNAKEPQSVYYCHLCGSEYIMKYNLEIHLERQHKEEERNALPQELIKCKMCDALFFNKRAYNNHNLFHKDDDMYVENEQQRQALVTRVDQDFDIRRVQTQAEKFIPKVESVNHNRKRKSTSTSKPNSSSSVRWKSSKSKDNAPDNGDSDDCLSSASSVEDSDEEPAKPAKDPLSCSDNPGTVEKSASAEMG